MLTYFQVSSTENGIIFGNIVYDISGAASDRNCVVLNDIHIDIMDYITPADCTDAEFRFVIFISFVVMDDLTQYSYLSRSRQMWAEFEWENKVTVNTNISALNGFLQHIIGSTNMRCLTPEKV